MELNDNQKHEAEKQADDDDVDDDVPPALIGRDKNEMEEVEVEEDDDEMPPVEVKEKTGGDDDDSSNTSEDDNEEEADGVASTENADLLLTQATGLKEIGNGHFKEGDLDQAARSYRRGVNKLKKLNKENTGDEQVKALLVTLQTNLSMVAFKQSRYKRSAEVAGKALGIDPANVKALYRRAVAQRKMGNLEDARDDLRAAIKVDASNTACKKELVAIKKELEQTKENQKKALAKAFSTTSSSFLYNDKEAAERKREEERQRKKKQEQELYKKRKAEWEDDCVKLMAKGEEAISFEDWEKKRKKEEEEARAKEEKERKEAERLSREERRKARELARKHEQGEESETEADELTEQELATMRGYKKTSDGRTTSYFHRELSEEEKARIGDIAPKRLDEASPIEHSASTGPVRLTAAAVPSPEGAVRTSAWNQAGTWEEKDTTDWCRSQLQKRLEETCVTTNQHEVLITSVEELTGDASVAITGGKKRYIFDFHARLKYDVEDKLEGHAVVGSGIVRLPDICSTHHDEIEIHFDGWNKTPLQAVVQEATEARSKLANELRASVQSWVQDFNEKY
jgi:tetratricopeptide (TPR) repeat protein